METYEKINTQLNELSDKRLETFRNEPKLIKSFYHGENRLKRDYKEREILELLQNAIDAFAENEKNEILISLLDNKFEISNTGTPFGISGIESLMTSDLSPKDKNKNIGNKGLGFRSILNWATEVKIFSNNGLSVSFSQDTSNAFYREKLKNQENYNFFSYPRIIDREELYDYSTKIVLIFEPERKNDIQKQL
ncbi:MAG: hypothetical protein FWH22_09650, partial [Fibromonadales bacterium]|nr:hypothetical protein [Fibromonadales bacterium]